MFCLFSFGITHFWGVGINRGNTVLVLIIRNIPFTDFLNEGSQEWEDGHSEDADLGNGAFAENDFSEDEFLPEPIIENDDSDGDFIPTQSLVSKVSKGKKRGRKPKKEIYSDEEDMPLRPRPMGKRKTKRAILSDEELDGQPIKTKTTGIFYFTERFKIVR